MSIVEARNFVMGIAGLSSDTKTYLKRLLNKGDIIPLAVIGSSVDDLEEIIEQHPLQITSKGDLVQVLSRQITEFLNNPKLGCVIAVRLFEQFKDGEISKEEINFVKKCLDDLVFEVVDGDTSNLNVYMETKPPSQRINVSSNWLHHMTKIPADSKEMKRHLHLLLVKGLNEIGHILSPLFMERLKMKKRNHEYATPTRIGTTKVGRKTIGDAGYGLEESLTGGRMFHQHPKGSGAFHIEALVIEKKVDGKWKRFEVKDSFLHRSSKRTVKSFEVKDAELVDMDGDRRIRKRKFAEIFLPTHRTVTDSSSSFKPAGMTSFFKAAGIPFSYRRT